jgi:MscS family membrane protein
MKLKLFICLLLPILLNAPVWAQQPDSTQTRQTEEEDRPYSLLSPKGAITRHLHFLQPATYHPDSAIQALRPGDRDSARQMELAIQLKQIYDGLGVYIDPEELPDAPDFRDSASGKHRFAPLPGHPEVYVQRYGNTWQYSNQSLLAIPAIHKKVFPIGANWLRAYFPDTKTAFLGLKPWQWAGLALLILAVVAVHFLMRWTFGRIIRLALPVITRSSMLDSTLIRRVAAPLSYFMLTFLIALALPSIQLPVAANKAILTVMRSLTGFFIIGAVYRAIDILGAIGAEFARRTETTMDDQLVPLAVKSLKAIVVVFGAIIILQVLHVNITALVAGVSIGGLALALAAQDTAKNFLGSVSIFLDRPFTVGDYIVTTQLAGTVEEVGVRSTRVRALDGALISIPNGVLANETVTNHGSRSFRRYQTELTITYGTPPEKIDAFVQGIRSILENHPDVRKEDGYQVYFHAMGPSSLNIFLAAWFMLPDYAQWLRARQEVFIQVLELAESMGISFAFPSTSVYLENFPAQEGRKPPMDLTHEIYPEEDEPNA